MAAELGFAVEAARPLHRRISVLQSFGVIDSDASGRFQFQSISGDGGEYGVVSGEIFGRPVTSSFGAIGERILSSPVSQVLAGLLAWPASVAALFVSPLYGCPGSELRRLQQAAGLWPFCFKAAERLADFVEVWWLDHAQASLDGGGRRWRVVVHELKSLGCSPGRWATADGYILSLGMGVYFDSFQSQRVMGLFL